jgi:hypothetical protein
MDNWSKVHVWVGINFNEEEFDKYFEMDSNPKHDDIYAPEYEVCQFCKDIGELIYDEDWIGVYVPAEGMAVVDIDIILKELQVYPKVFEEIKKICIEKGYKKSNIMFYYYDAELVIKDIDKLYNRLSYIGVFDTVFED